MTFTGILLELNSLSFSERKKVERFILSLKPEMKKKEKLSKREFGFGKGK
jgi:hypothetical protein